MSKLTDELIKEWKNYLVWRSDFFSKYGHTKYTFSDGTTIDVGTMPSFDGFIEYLEKGKTNG